MNSLRRPTVIALAVLAVAAVLAANFALQPMPLRDWLPQFVIATGAVAVLLLLNVGWVRGLHAAVHDAESRGKSHGRD
jgi:hypothetical protein